MNLSTLRKLAELDNAAATNVRVRFSIDGGEHVIDGVARHFTRDTWGNFLRDNDDVLSSFFRVSATVEHFLPVRVVLTMMDTGLFSTELQVA